MTAADILVPCDGCGGRCTNFGTLYAKVERIAAEAERRGLRLEHRRKSPKGAFMWNLAVIGGGPLAVKGATLDFLQGYLESAA